MLFARQTGQGVTPKLLRGVAHGFHRRVYFIGQKHPLCAPVVGMLLAADPAIGLQAVKQTAQGRLFNLQDVGKLGLGNPIITVEMGQNPPLRTRQTKRFHAPIVGRAQQARDVVKDKTKISR